MQTEYLTFIADFKVQGRLAYLSHQETLSLWQRILVRAHVPLVYSRGFNPRPRMSLPLPRSVGVQSDCERLCALVEADGFCNDVMREAIVPLLPDGCVLQGCSAAAGRAVYYPVSVTYQFLLHTEADAARRAHVQHCQKQLQSDAPINLSRQLAKGRQRPVDIRPFLQGLTADYNVVQAVCVINPAGTVRIDELMRWLGLQADDLAEPVRRIAVQWVSNTDPLQGEYHLS